MSHRPPNAPVLRCENMMNECVERGRGRPKITSKKVYLKNSSKFFLRIYQDPAKSSKRWKK